MSFFEAFALERYFAKHEFNARYLLCSSDCESLSIKELLALEEGSKERFLEHWLGYTETRGAPTLKEAIAAHYPGLASDDIFVHSGAEEAILNLCLAVLEKGDRVIVNYPCYQSLAEIPGALGCKVMPWELRISQNAKEGLHWALDPDELHKLGPAKLIILNSPHNPTGAMLSPEQFKAVIDYARKTGALLLVDEVYRRLEHNSHSLPSVSELYENGIALDVLSKHSGLAGLRIGWLASKRADLLDKVALVKDYNSICASAPSEFLAELAVKNLNTIAAKNRALVNKNLALAGDFFSRRPDFAEWIAPEGGSIAFPRLTAGKDAGALAEKLVAEAGVLILPGKLYGYNNSHFRLGYGRANFPEALSELEAWLKKSHT